jgi:hypothetical protein
LVVWLIHSSWCTSFLHCVTFESVARKQCGNIAWHGYSFHLEQQLLLSVCIIRSHRWLKKRKAVKDER